MTILDTLHLVPAILRTLYTVFSWVTETNKTCIRFVYVLRSIGIQVCGLLTCIMNHSNLEVQG